MGAMIKKMLTHMANLTRVLWRIEKLLPTSHPAEFKSSTSVVLSCKKLFYCEHDG